nr:CRE-SRT-61 protein [Haemonchus contortus]
MIIELSTILISAVFYILVIIALYRTRRRFMSNSNSRSEMKVLIQALVITAYCTILNFLWHNAQAILPPIIWTYMAVNMMWILNSGVYPIIYLVVNRAIRDKIHPRQVSVQDHPMTTKHHISVL